MNIFSRRKKMNQEDIVVEAKNYAHNCLKPIT